MVILYLTLSLEILSVLGKLFSPDQPESEINSEVSEINMRNVMKIF